MSGRLLQVIHANLHGFSCFLPSKDSRPNIASWGGTQHIPVTLTKGRKDIPIANSRIRRFIRGLATHLSSLAGSKTNLAIGDLHSGVSAKELSLTILLGEKRLLEREVPRTVALHSTDSVNRSSPSSSSHPLQRALQQRPRHVHYLTSNVDIAFKQEVMSTVSVLVNGWRHCHVCSSLHLVKTQTQESRIYRKVETDARDAQPVIDIHLHFPSTPSFNFLPSLSVVLNLI